MIDGLANREHLAGVPVIPILDDGDVDVDDVTVLEAAIAGDSVTHGMVDGGADRLGESVVVERSRNRLLGLDDVFVAASVELSGRDPRLHVRANHVQDVRRQPASDPHARDIFSVLGGVSQFRRLVVEIGASPAHVRPRYGWRMAMVAPIVAEKHLWYKPRPRQATLAVRTAGPEFRARARVKWTRAAFTSWAESGRVKTTTHACRQPSPGCLSCDTSTRGRRQGARGGPTRSGVHFDD